MKENYNEKEWRLSTVEQALDASRQGGIVIVVDDEDREMRGTSLLPPRR